MSSLFGSICLSDIPREQIKKIMCKDGKERMFINVFIGEKRTPQTFNGRTITHYVSCAPKKEERRDDVNYFIGDLETFNPLPMQPTAEQINQAAPIGDDDDLPF